MTKQSEDPPPQGRPTIVDVARLAGVSKSLVSLVLHDSPRVSEARRRAVLDAATELGYTPNRVARSLVLQRTHLIGLVISDLHNPFHADVCDVIQAMAEQEGYRAVVGSSGLDAVREAGLADTFLELRADGVILIGPILPIEEITRIARQAPAVVVSRHDTWRAGVDTVTDDDALGVSLAVEHLVSLGHQRIAHITGGGGAGAAERRAGYVAAMEKHGLARQAWTVEGEFTEKGGYDAVPELLGAPRRPTAIIAGNDLAAVGVLQAIEDAGWSVPEDISLVGYDNTSLAAMERFSITSLDQSRAELGRLAVETLTGSIRGTRSSVAHKVVTPTLVVRRSTGPAP